MLTKKKIINFTIVAIMVVLSMISVFAFTNVASAEEAQPYGDVIVGDVEGDGTYENPYHEKPWHGRITTKENIYDNYYIEINVDPRDSMFGDDIIIEYKYFYIDSSNKRQPVKLQKFEAEIQFRETHKGVIKYFDPIYISKANDNEAGFTKHSGTLYADQVTVKVTVTTSASLVKSFYYKFTN